MIEQGLFLPRWRGVSAKCQESESGPGALGCVWVEKPLFFLVLFP